MTTSKEPTPQEFFEAAELLQEKAEEMRGNSRGDLQHLKDVLEAAKWYGEPSGNPLKGWVTDSRGNRFTSLGSRHGYGKFLDVHNQQISYLVATLDRLIAEHEGPDNKAALDDYKPWSGVDVEYAEPIILGWLSAPYSPDRRLLGAVKRIMQDRAALQAKVPVLRGLIAAAGRCANNSANASVMGSTPFEQSVSARNYIDEAIKMLDYSYTAAPQPPTMQGEK